MKKALKYLSSVIIGILVTISIIVTCYADNTIYCKECGKKIDADSKFCMYCGTDLKTAAVSQSYDNISFSKSERKTGSSFKNTDTAYNIFPYEVTDCCGIYFYYTAKNGSSVSCTGTRDVYVRDKTGEDSRDDSKWIYVGSFDYRTAGEAVTVDMKWTTTDVYAVAVVRQNINTNCSFTASWGDTVTFYRGEYVAPSNNAMSFNSVSSDNEASGGSSSSESSGSWEKVVCGKCYGGTCTHCMGSGYKTCTRNSCIGGKCSFCGGTNRNLKTGKPCTVCYNGDCTTCGGDGKIDCGFCNGTGECPYCDGTGFKSVYQ